MGTYGYAAPEYVATGHLYVKSNVYGFGVVRLEMLSGQRALDPNRPNGQLSLADWAKPYLADRRKLARLMDPRFEGQYNSKQSFQVAQLTLNCLAGEPRSRGGAGDAGAHRVVEEPGPGGPGRRQRRRRAVAGPPPRPHRHRAPPAVVAPRRRRASRRGRGSSRAGNGHAGAKAR